MLSPVTRTVGSTAAPIDPPRTAGDWANEVLSWASPDGIVLHARRAESNGRIDVRHDAEVGAPDAVEAALERELSAPFAADYQDLLEQARLRLASLSEVQ